MLKRHRIFGAVGGLLLAALLSAGCGKKADPVPVNFMPPAVISELGADSLGEGTGLQWSISGTVDRIDHFRIFRSEADADRACPGCPQEYRLLDTLKLSDPRLHSDRGKGFRWVDAAVTAGRFYSYRISACNVWGRCGEPSAPARIVKEQPGVLPEQTEGKENAKKR